MQLNFVMTRIWPRSRHQLDDLADLDFIAVGIEQWPEAQRGDVHRAGGKFKTPMAARKSLTAIGMRPLVF